MNWLALAFRGRKSKFDIRSELQGKTLEIVGKEIIPFTQVIKDAETASYGSFAIIPGVVAEAEARSKFNITAIAHAGRIGRIKGLGKARNDAIGNGSVYRIAAAWDIGSVGARRYWRRSRHSVYLHLLGTVVTLGNEAGFIGGRIVEGP